MSPDFNGGHICKAAVHGSTRTWNGHQENVHVLVFAQHTFQELLLLSRVLIAVNWEQLMDRSEANLASPAIGTRVLRLIA